VSSVAYVSGGGALNVIPPYVELAGTLRSLTTEGMQRLQQRLKEEKWLYPEVELIKRIQMIFKPCCGRLSNYWTDKKPAVVNQIEGRGKSEVNAGLYLGAIGWKNQYLATCKSSWN
nr:IAA-amino acid hydrolase ILR1-like 5 [Tanacetum cinerariifolium]